MQSCGLGASLPISCEVLAAQATLPRTVLPSRMQLESCIAWWLMW